jgi:heterodisulfide reductase subunit A-like polyferredoxin
MLSLVAPLLVVLSAAVPAAWAEIDVSSFSAKDTIVRDVVIIGGGASGAHAAVRLQEKYGKSVIVVEQDSILACCFCHLILCPPTLPRHLGWIAISS